MNVLFSESTQAFYALDIDYPNLPEDVVEIDKTTHTLLLEKLNTCHKVVKNDDFYDFIFLPPVLSWEEIRAKRDALLSRSDYTQALDWPGDRAAWSVYRQVLRDLPSMFQTTSEIIWPTPPE